jgi:hypothetical protein
MANRRAHHKLTRSTWPDDVLFLNQLENTERTGLRNEEVDHPAHQVAERGIDRIIFALLSPVLQFLQKGDEKDLYHEALTHHRN